MTTDERRTGYNLKRGWKDRFRCWLVKRIVPREVRGWVDTGFTFLYIREREKEIEDQLRKHPPEIHDLAIGGE